MRHNAHRFGAITALPLDRRRTGVRRGPAAALLAAGLLATPAARTALRPDRRASPPARPAPPVSHGAGTPSEAARHEAQWFWFRARQAANRQCEGAEAWDPALADIPYEAARRQQFLARDPEGDLQHGLHAAQRSAALAGTPEEAYQATLWLVRIEHDSGRHRAALQHARRLMALAPRNRTSILWLWHAAVCTGRKDLARQADRAMHALPPAARAPLPHAGPRGRVGQWGRGLPPHFGVRQRAIALGPAGHERSVGRWQVRGWDAEVRGLAAIRGRRESPH